MLSNCALALEGMARPQVSGLNLLKYNTGKHGAPCYHRYLRGMYQLIHKNGGGLAYYGKVRYTLNPKLAEVQCGQAWRALPPSQLPQHVPARPEEGAACSSYV